MPKSTISETWEAEGEGQYLVKIINLKWRDYKFHEACLD